jgi:hypothetical protein
MVRKRKPAKRAARRRIAISMSAASYRQLERLADKNGLRPTSYVAALVRIALREGESGDLFKG